MITSYLKKIKNSSFIIQVQNKNRKKWKVIPIKWIDPEYSSTDVSNRIEGNKTGFKITGNKIGTADTLGLIFKSKEVG